MAVDDECVESEESWCWASGSAWSAGSSCTQGSSESVTAKMRLANTRGMVVRGGCDDIAMSSENECG